MKIKNLLGSEITKRLNKAKKLYSPEYEQYYTSNITPLIVNKIKEIDQQIEELDQQIEELETIKSRLDYNFRLPTSEIKLKELLNEMGYNER